MVGIGQDLLHLGRYFGTTITIDAPFAQLTGVLSFERNAANTPVFLRATGDVVINGTINVSAPLYTVALGRQVGGPGGGDGGDGPTRSRPRFRTNLSGPTGLSLPNPRPGLQGAAAPCICRATIPSTGFRDRQRV